MSHESTLLQSPAMVGVVLWKRIRDWIDGREIDEELCRRLDEAVRAVEQAKNEARNRASGSATAL